MDLVKAQKIVASRKARRAAIETYRSLKDNLRGIRSRRCGVNFDRYCPSDTQLETVRAWAEEQMADIQEVEQDVSAAYAEIQRLGQEYLSLSENGRLTEAAYTLLGKELTA